MRVSAQTQAQLQTISETGLIRKLGQLQSNPCQAGCNSWTGPARSVVRLAAAKPDAAAANKSEARAVKTQPVYTRLNLEFLEAILGAQKTVHADVLRICPDCKGRRVRPGVAASSCGFCRGSGQVLRSRAGMTWRCT